MPMIHIMPSVLISMFLLFIFQVVFYSSYCLDIYVCSENYIKVRDAAISLFNQGKAMEEIQPIPFIKNFLLRYVDEAALQRRQSQAAEDDNPPSPTMVGGTYTAGVYRRSIFKIRPNILIGLQKLRVRPKDQSRSRLFIYLIF